MNVVTPIAQEAVSIRISLFAIGVSYDTAAIEQTVSNVATEACSSIIVEGFALRVGRHTFRIDGGVVVAE